MRVHLVRADELHPGDIVVGTDQDGLYTDGPRTLVTTEPTGGDPGLRLAWTAGPPTEYHPHAVLLVDPGR